MVQGRGRKEAWIGNIPGFEGASFYSIDARGLALH